MKHRNQKYRIGVFACCITIRLGWRTAATRVSVAGRMHVHCMRSTTTAACPKVLAKIRAIAQWCRLNEIECYHSHWGSTLSDTFSLVTVCCTTSVGNAGYRISPFRNLLRLFFFRLMITSCTALGAWRKPLMLPLQCKKSAKQARTCTLEQAKPVCVCY